MPPHGDSRPFLANETSTPPVQWNQLEPLILDYYEKVKLTKEESLEAVAFTQNLECEIRKTMPGARLEIGGSLCNGFGTHDSDLDLCFRLEDDNPPKGFNELKTLTDLSEILAGIGINNRIIKSRVNIIKCEANNSVNRSMDIFCYNTLALYNTKLLAKYCEWEPKRLPALGVWVKRWAKTCDIGDASEGTISSYAWMIILIHYLQNCSPPVLPRLQEDFRTNATVPFLHMECDVYFHETVHIVQIRQKAEVMKWEKGWGRSRICVEDPFLLSHNLTERKEKNVITFIWKTVFHSEKAFLMAEEFEAEKVLESCRLKSERGIVKRCVICDCRGLCDDGCENRYERHPNWVPRADYPGRHRLKLLNNQVVKRVTICPLCEMLGPCKDGCENRYERHPNWVSNSERVERRRLKKELKGKARILRENHPTKRPEFRENRNRRQVNRMASQFSNLMISQQNLALHLQYPMPFPWVPSATQTYYYPAPTHLPPPPLGLPLGSFTLPPHVFIPQISNEKMPQQQKALFNPTATKVPRVPELPMKNQKPFNGTWAFYNNSHQPTSQQAPTDFNNEDDFPAL